MSKLLRDTGSNKTFNWHCISVFKVNIVSKWHLVKIALFISSFFWGGGGGGLLVVWIKVKENNDHKLV